jgi:hypothetical protein
MEDDVYIHLPGVVRHLYESIAAIRVGVRSGRVPMAPRARHNITGDDPHIFWGIFEGFHWMTNPAYHAARGATNYHLMECLASPMPLGRVGPFVFAKGPCLFLSASLGARVVSDAGVQAEAAATIRLAEVRRTARVYEDVFLGYAVAVAADAPVHVVHDSTMYHEDAAHHELHLAPSALITHLRRNKSAESMRLMHGYLEHHHCQPRDLQIQVHPDYAVLCSGAPWYSWTPRRGAYDGCFGRGVPHAVPASALTYL